MFWVAPTEVAGTFDWSQDMQDTCQFLQMILLCFYREFKLNQYTTP